MERVLFPNGKVLLIGSLLDLEMITRLTDFLEEKMDVFAWSLSDMHGIDPEIAIHELNVDPSFQPIRQRKRPIKEIKLATATTELQRLLDIGFIREVQYPDWLADIPSPESKFKVAHMRRFHRHSQGMPEGQLSPHSH